MVVAVVAVGMMEMVADEIVDVVAVRDRVVAAPRAMGVVGRVPAAGVLGRAIARIGATDGEHVLVDMVLVDVVEMPIVQVVRVAVVLDGGMAAPRPVGMVVIGMRDVVLAHGGQCPAEPCATSSG
jgi:hypothetical protein